MARVTSGAVGPREKEITADTICATATNLLLALYKEFQVTLGYRTKFWPQPGNTGIGIDTVSA